MPRNAVRPPAPVAEPAEETTDWSHVSSDILLQVFAILDDKRDQETSRHVRSACRHWKDCHDEVVTWLSPKALKPSSSLQRFPRVRELNLRRCGQPGSSAIPRNALASISALQSLTFLDVSGAAAWSDGVVASVADRLPLLSTLLMERCDCMSDRGAWSLISCTNLTRVSVYACSQISNEGVAALGSLPSLRDLNLARCKHVNDHGLNILAEQRTPLERLVLAWTRGITNAGLLSVSQISTLVDLELVRLREISSAGLAYLAFLPSLRRLSLEWCDTVEGSDLGKITTLSELRLAWCDGISDVGAATVSSLPSLRLLDLASCVRVTDLAIAQFTKLCNLSSLNLSYCRYITDSSLNVLASMPSLQVLLLDACDRITDRGLRHLCSSPSLQHLSVAGCYTTHKGHEWLWSSIPGLTIDIKLKDDCSAQFSALALKCNNA